MQKISEQLKNDINTTYNEVINKTIKNKLGVEVKMQVDDFGKVTDSIKTDVDKKMRGNKILRRLFKSAELYGYAYEFPEEGQIGITFSIGYHHPDNAWNGKEMMVLYICRDTGKVKVRK